MPEYRYEIGSQTAEVAALIKELARKWQEAGLDEKSIFRLHLALEEAVVNGIKHGNRFNPDLKVQVRCRISEKNIEIAVTDQGQGFDAKSLPDPTVTENIPKRSGRGVYLIRQFMDKVEFLDNGRTVKMTKVLEPKQNSLSKEGKMKIDTENTGEITICKIEGEINIDNSHQLRRSFDDLAKQGVKKIIIDFSSLDYIDSSGLATLIEMFQRLKKIDGSLRLCGLNDKVRSVFEITKLNTLFCVYDNTETAREGL